MQGATLTRPSLLLAIRDAQNNAAWEQFIDLYTPLVFTHCRGRGLQEADAADVSQEVMRAVAAAIRRFEYDRARGAFRTWLLTVTRSKLNNFFSSHARIPVAVGDTAMQEKLENVPPPDEGEEWEHEFRQRLFQYTAEKIRDEFQEKTWLAFWQSTVENKPVDQVAALLGLSVGAVYIARSRVTARLRARISQLSDEPEWFEATEQASMVPLDLS